MKTVTTLLLCGSFGISLAQGIRPPGYEREISAMEERQKTSVLDRDSVAVLDTIVVFDPISYKDTTQFVVSHISWRDYCQLRLGINKPEELLSGQPVQIVDPKTFEDMTVRWNSGTMKLDTIR